MGWFFKSEPKTNEAKAKVCSHKWKDFPWYVESTYYPDNGRFVLAIYEPYVCIQCKERKDVLLHKLTRNSLSYTEALALRDATEEKYKDHILDKVYVEDMINDFCLVDREYLQIVEQITNPPKSELENEMAKLISTIKAGSLPALK